MESYGTGIGRIKELCDKAGIDIECVGVPSGTKLAFHRNDALAASPKAKVRERFAGRLTEPEMLLSEYVEESGSVTTTDAMGIVGLQRRGTQNMLNRLIDAGVLRRVGRGRSTRYVINGSESGE